MYRRVIAPCENTRTVPSNSFPDPIVRSSREGVLVDKGAFESSLASASQAEAATRTFNLESGASASASDSAVPSASPAAPWGVPEVALFLGVERKRVLRFAATGELPGARIGRAWIFDPADVQIFRKRVIDEQTARRRHASAANSERAAPRWTGRRRPLPKLPELPRRRNHE